MYLLLLTGAEVSYYCDAISAVFLVRALQILVEELCLPVHLQHAIAMVCRGATKKSRGRGAQLSGYPRSCRLHLGVSSTMTPDISRQWIHHGWTRPDASGGKMWQGDVLFG